MGILATLDRMDPQVPDASEIMDLAISAALADLDEDVEDERTDLIKHLLAAYITIRGINGEQPRVLDGHNAVQVYYTKVYEQATGQTDTSEWEWWREDLPINDVPATFVARIAKVTAQEDNLTRSQLRTLAEQENA